MKRGKKMKELLGRAEKIIECKKIVEAFNIQVSKGSHGEANLNDLIDVIRELYENGYDLETISFALKITLAETLLCVGIKRPAQLTPQQFFGYCSIYEESENPDMVLIADESVAADSGFCYFCIYENKTTRENYVIITVYNELIERVADIDMILYSRSSDNSNYDNAKSNPLIINRVVNEVGKANLYAELKPILEEMLKYSGIDIAG
jgi:hypothetical protein